MRPAGAVICYNQSMRKILLLIPVLLLSACALQSSPSTSQVTPSATAPAFATATLVPTFTPRPSATTAVPTIAPTIAPIMGSMTAQVNVRLGPDKKMTSLGLLEFGTRVQVIGHDSSGKWLRIIYPENSNSSGWITVEFVQMAEGDVARVPLVEYLPATQNASASVGSSTPPGPTATLTPNAKTASVTKQIYVRKGPGQSFEALGMINAGTQVTLTGRSQTDIWLQILFKDGVDGKGWVASAYVSGADLRGLPYFDNQGNPISAGTPAPGSSGPTPTAFSPAAVDSDSEQNPSVRLKFAPDASREFTFSSDLSSPNGDATDWVAFTPYEPANQSTYLYLKLECSGNGGITAILEKDGQPVPDVKPLVCGNYGFAIHVLGGHEYILVLSADGSGSTLRYTRYTLYVKSEP